jgi:hypothetical protein
MDPKYVTAVRNDLAVRWDGSSLPHYEAWWTTLNQLNTAAGFRIGYVLLGEGDVNPQGEVWFTSFVNDTESANVAVAQMFPADQVTVAPDHLPLRIGPCSMESGRITGMLPAGPLPVTWDLVYEPVTESLRYLPERLYHRAGYRLLVPYPFMIIGGKIQIGDHRFVLNGDPGQQQHVWGGLPSAEWAWFHCSSFAGESGNPIPAYVTGLSRLEGRVARAPKPASSGHLVWNERHLELHPVSSWENRWSEAWEWSARSNEEEIRIILAVPWNHMVVARHQHEGNALYCHYSSRAVCTVNFKAPRQPPRIFHSGGKAHMEIGSRHLDPRVSRVVEIGHEFRKSGS